MRFEIKANGKAMKEADAERTIVNAWTKPGIDERDNRF
jgi:hypothetical protein